jgi:hypothetical protein
MKETSLFAREPWNPDDNSATRKQERMNIVNVAIERPMRKARNNLVWGRLVWRGAPVVIEEGELLPSRRTWLA